MNISSLFNWRAVAGIVIGLMLGSVVISISGGRFLPINNRPQSGPILSECNGSIRRLVIQWTQDSDFAAGIYHQFLPQLSSQVEVYVVCPDRTTYEKLLGQLGKIKCHLTPVITNHALTTWSRDRWLAAAPVAVGRPVVLISPRGEAGSEIWPARAGDQRIAEDLAQADHRSIQCWKSEIYFDGGDVTADDRCAFVVPQVLRRNLQKTVQTPQELQTILSKELRRKIVMLRQSPEHHAGMFMMPVGDQTMLVADPSLGKPFSTSCELPGGADFSDSTQQLYDAVAAEVAAEGYRVVRIPQIPAVDGKTYLTYVNVLMDFRNGMKTVYMPEYRGAEKMNAAAQKVWEGLGFQVRCIDCTGVYQQFGTLHCLVNVLEKS